MRRFTDYFLLALFFLFGAGQSPAWSKPIITTDFDLDNRDEIALWSKTKRTFQVYRRSRSTPTLLLEKRCGLPGDIPILGDVSGDAIPDFLMFRERLSPNPSSLSTSLVLCRPGEKATRSSFGRNGDVPILAFDFDGDGAQDATLFRKQTAEWIQTLSVSNTTAVLQYGQPGDLPVPEDYDGDGRADEALYRPSAGTWHIRYSATRKKKKIFWGGRSDIPLPGDFDGDSRADLALYRPEEGTWHIRHSAPGSAKLIFQFGSPPDYPLSLDLNGDGKKDFALLRQRKGRIVYKSDALSKTKSILINPGNYLSLSEHRPRNIAVSDADGDGRSDFAVIRKIGAALVWFSSDITNQPLVNISWGLFGDQALFQDLTGDGKADFVVLRPINGLLQWFIRSGNTSEAPLVKSFGLPSDVVIPDDYDGDRLADLAVVRKTTDRSLAWFVESTLTGQILAQRWGLVGDHISRGDFDGDGQADPTVIRNIGGFLYWFSLNLLSKNAATPVQWGLAGDEIVTLDYDGDGRRDYAIVRNIAGYLYLLIRLNTGEILTPIQWGISGDTFIPGQYLSGYKTLPSVFRTINGAGFFFTNLGEHGLVSNQWGLKGDIPIVGSKVIATISPD